MTRLHEWAATTDTGDRDELIPGVDDRAWRQVSVNARECIGAQKCPFGTHCFAELAREEAGEADIVVTNHALLAIDAMEDFIVLPEHDVVVIDEAHDLVDRVTIVASDELSAPAVEAAARRCGRMVGENLTERLREAGEAAGRALAEIAGRPAGYPRRGPGCSLASVRDAAAAARPSCGPSPGLEDDTERLAASRAALAALDELAENGRPDDGGVRPGDRRAAGRGVAGPPGGRGPSRAAHAPGRAAAGRRPCSPSGCSAGGRSC